MSSAFLCSRNCLRISIAAMASSLLLLTGCSLQTTALEGNSFVANGSLSGRIIGGQQPVVGSTINLYAVGKTGYGTGAVLLATGTSAGGGSFTFNQVSTQTGASSPVSATYGCPTSSTLIYLTASGGDPTGVGTSSNFNTNIKLLDALGQCSQTASTFYVVNEAASVASIAALQQYVNPATEQIGSPTTTGSGSQMAAATTGIANAFALVPNLVNQQAGVTNTTFTPVSPGGGTVTATVESGKINTIADVIAACINTTGSSSSYCSSLYAAATPPQVPTATNFPSSYTAAPTATDTLQAVLFMLQNPADAGTQVSAGNCAFSSTASTNISCLYAAQTGTAPFAGLTSQPTDWSIGLTYASASTTTVGTSAVGYFGSPSFLAVDKSGDIWVTNAVTTTGSSVGNSLVEVSPQGGVKQLALTASGVLAGAHTPVIDPSGNVWVPNFGSSSSSSTTGYGKTVIEYVPGTSTTNSFNVAGGPTSVGSDGAGNIFLTEISVAGTGSGNDTAGADLEKIASGAAGGSTVTVLASITAASYTELAIDSSFNVWTTGGASSSDVYVFEPSTTYSAPTFSSASYTTSPETIMIDHSNDAWLANYGGGLSELQISGNPAALGAASGSPFTGGGLAKAEYQVLDGAGNSWITNYVSKAGSVAEFANNGTALSPTAAFAHTFYGAYGIAVDPSGNVWVGNYSSSNTTAAQAATGSGPGGSAGGGIITEIIGAAVPVVTPIAAGLPATAGGTSYLATAPQ
jgi:hypothetical protein